MYSHVILRIIIIGWICYNNLCKGTTLSLNLKLFQFVMSQPTTIGFGLTPLINSLPIETLSPKLLVII